MVSSLARSVATLDWLSKEIAYSLTVIITWILSGILAWTKARSFNELESGKQCQGKLFNCCWYNFTHGQAVHIYSGDDNCRTRSFNNVKFTVNQRAFKLPWLTPCWAGLQLQPRATLQVFIPPSLSPKSMGLSSLVSWDLTANVTRHCGTSQTSGCSSTDLDLKIDYLRQHFSFSLRTTTMLSVHGMKKTVFSFTTLRSSYSVTSYFDIEQSSKVVSQYLLTYFVSIGIQIVVSRQVKQHCPCL